MEPIENNKIIAEFMGLVYKYDGLYHHTQRFNKDGTPTQSGSLIKSEWNLWYPHNDWNCIMEVVEKIEGINPNLQSFTVSGKRVEIRDFSVRSLLFSGYYEGETKIEAMYEAVVEFIKWYSKQK